MRAKPAANPGTVGMSAKPKKTPRPTSVLVVDDHALVRKRCEQPRDGRPGQARCARNLRRGDRRVRARDGPQHEQPAAEGLVADEARRGHT